jgi:hypothetical protein
MTLLQFKALLLHRGRIESAESFAIYFNVVACITQM